MTCLRPLACLCAVGLSVLAQTPAPPLTFEVATLKLHPPGGPEGNASTERGGPGTSGPGQFFASNRTLRGLLVEAYAIKGYQLLVPDALTDVRYDIAAKVQPGIDKHDFHVMLQNLLIERLKLKIHREQRLLSVYALTLAKSGAKLKPSDDSPVPQPAANARIGPDGFPIQPLDPVKGGIYSSFNSSGNGKITAAKQTVSQLIGMISGEFDAPILDQTGLAGKFDFTLNYASHWTRAGASPSSADPRDTFEGSGPTISEALEKQLGLRLETRKVPTEMIVVDSGEKAPIEN